MPSFYLVNVLKRKKESPYTFFVPSKQVIDQLKKGDVVKLIFLPKTPQDGSSGESMWVEITRRSGDRFVGTLVSQPYHLKGLKSGETILFAGKNICQTHYQEPSSREWKFYHDTKVMVSTDVLARKEFNLMWREEQVALEDSGWNFITGYEEKEFLKDHKNYKVVSIGVLLNFDDSILDFIEDSPLAGYVRTGNRKFTKVENDQIVFF